MGIYLRYAAALIILATVSDGYAATRKNVSMPSKGAVVNNSDRSFQTPNGSAAFFGQEFVDQHTAGNRFNAGDSPGTPKQKITLKPTLTANPGNVAKKAVQALRGGGLAGVALQGAISAAVAAAGAVIDSAGNVSVPGFTLDGQPVDVISGENDPQYICSILPASKTLNKVTIMEHYGIKYAVLVAPASSFDMSYDLKSNNCTQTANGYYSDRTTGAWPRSGAKRITASDVEEGSRAPGDIEFDAMEQFIANGGSDFIRDIVKETCNGSLNPAACFEDMTQWGDLFGPSSATGPAQTTTSTTTNPDGSTSTTATTTQNRYNYNYGDNYYNYSTTTTTSTTRDGLTTTTETSDGSPTDETTAEENPDESEESYTFDDSEMPEVPSFYEQKYPDGLQGVWSNASAQVDGSQFMQFLNGFVPSFSGSCPSFGLSFNIASWASYGSVGFGSLCYVFDFIKVILLVTALFTFRAVTFGG